MLSSSNDDGNDNNTCSGGDHGKTRRRQDHDKLDVPIPALRFSLHPDHSFVATGRRVWGCGCPLPSHVRAANSSRTGGEVCRCETCDTADLGGVAQELPEGAVLPLVMGIDGGDGDDAGDGDEIRERVWLLTGAAGLALWALFLVWATGQAAAWVERIGGGL